MIFSMEKLPKNRRPSFFSDGLVFSLIKKIMSFWIEPNVKGLEGFKSDLGFRTKICYALLYESTTDLALLKIACKAHKLPTPFGKNSASFFFIRRSEGLLGRKTVLRVPPQISQITNTEKKTTQEKTLVVPV